MNPNDEDFRSGLKCAVHFLNDPPIQPNILTLPKLSNYPLTFSYIHHILQFFSDFFSFPTPRGCIVTQSPFTASSPRGPRMLSPCLWRPRLRLGGAWKQSYLALMGLNNQQLGRETIIIGLLSIIYSYIYMWICIYIYIFIYLYIYIHLKKIPNMLCPISLSPSMLFLLNIRGICVGNDGIDGF